MFISSIREFGGYTPKCVMRAIREGFDLFDSYVFQRNKKKIKFNGLEFTSYDALVNVYNQKTEKDRNYGVDFHNLGIAAIS